MFGAIMAVACITIIAFYIHKRIEKAIDARERLAEIYRAIELLLESFVAMDVLGKRRESKNADCSSIWTLRFFFYAGDRAEPTHVHVEREDNVAKFWLDPVRLQWSGGFRRHELGKVEKIIDKHYSELIEAWNEYFGD